MDKFELNQSVCRALGLPAEKQPATNIADAFEAVGKMRAQLGPGCFTLTDDVDPDGKVVYACDVDGQFGTGETAALAISRALFLRFSDTP